MATRTASTTNDQELNDGMAEIELQKLQRQYRIMEGDRKAYSEESRILIGKQRATIEKLKKDNEHLQDELRLLEQRNEDRRKNGIQSKKAESMAEQAESLQRKIKSIVSQIADLDQETTKFNDEIDVQRAKLGGVNAARQNNDAIDKQVRVLENRLDKALVKFNRALAVNKRLRAIIDNLRRERLVFDTIYHKFERELLDQKKQMADIIEMSNAAYEARDEAQTKILALREKAEKEYLAYVQEMKELERTLEQDRRLKEFMATKVLDRSERVVVNGAHGKDGDKKGEYDSHGANGMGAGALSGGAKFPSQESLATSLETYETAFSEIRKVTGITDIGELVQRFKAVENQNFSLFNYVNEVNNEIEHVSEEIVEIQTQIDTMKVEAVKAEEERKRVVKGLEEELKVAGERAQGYEKQGTDVSMIMSDLRSAIEALITTFQNAAAAAAAAAAARRPDGSAQSQTQIMDAPGTSASLRALNATQSGGASSLHASMSGADGDKLAVHGDESTPASAMGSTNALNKAKSIENTTEGAADAGAVSADGSGADAQGAPGQQQGQPPVLSRPDSPSRDATPGGAQRQHRSPADRLRAHFEFNRPTEGVVGSSGVSETNLVQFLGAIEHKANDLLTLNFLINSPKKAAMLQAQLQQQAGQQQPGAPSSASGAGATPAAGAAGAAAGSLTPGAPGMSGTTTAAPILPPGVTGFENPDGTISLLGAGGFAGLLGQGPIAPVGNLTIVAPSTGDDHDSADNLSDEEDRPLTREELRQKTLRGISRREKTATAGQRTQTTKNRRKPVTAKKE